MAHQSNAPGWPLRKVFDVAERAVAARVEPLVQTGGFATAISRYVAINRRVGRVLSKVTGGVLHLVNIPTTNDVAQLHEHLNVVNKQLSQLTRELGRVPASRQEDPQRLGTNIRTTPKPVDAQPSKED